MPGRDSVARAKRVLRPKFFFFELVQLQLFGRREAQTAVEGFDAGREVGMPSFEVLSGSFGRKGSSLLLGHITSGLRKGFKAKPSLGAPRRPISSYGSAPR